MPNRRCVGVNTPCFSREWRRRRYHARIDGALSNVVEGETPWGLVMAQNVGVRVRKVALVTVAAALLSLRLSMGTSEAAPASQFSFSVHRAALLRTINAVPHGGHINQFQTYPSRVDPRWVYFIVGTPLREPNGSVEENSAQGVAHWVRGAWHLVLGPGSGFCLYPKALASIPKRVLHSLPTIC